MKTYWKGVTNPEDLISFLSSVSNRGSSFGAAGQLLADWASNLEIQIRSVGLATASKEIADSFVHRAREGSVDEGTFVESWHLSQFFKKFRFGCTMSDETAHKGFLERNSLCGGTINFAIRARMRSLLASALPFVGEAEGRFGPGVTLDTDATYRSKLRYVASFHGQGNRIYERSSLDSVSRAAKLIAVPKDMSKLRTITVEPLACQWQQQSVRTRMLNSIHHGILRGTVMDLGMMPTYELNGVALERGDDSVTKQRVRCVKGSLDGTLATMDLSDASDTISWDIVKDVFPAWVLTAIEPIRSEEVFSKVLNTSASLRMYAGMGNATTFVIETLYFWALLTAIAEELHMGKPLVTVFGDDIVIRQKFATNEWFLGRLRDAGVRINLSKCGLSAGPGFREACGLVSYKSVVIPGTFRFYGYAASREGAIGYCDLTSRLLESPNLVMNTLGWMLMTWDGAPDAPLLTTSPEYANLLAYRIPERGILRVPDGVHLRATKAMYRFNRPYQRIECKVPCLRARRARFTIQDPVWGPGVIRSWGWWAYKLATLGKQTLDVRDLPKAREVTYAVPHRTCVRRQWVPCRDLFACEVCR